MSSPSPDLRTSLLASLDEAEWSWLARHAERDAVILVQAGVEMIDAALHVAQNNASIVQEWIAQGKLSKPTRAQLDAWNAEPTRRFLALVVQPYVLAQEIVH